MVVIPDSIMQHYREIADDFIDVNFGVDCTLYYPVKRVACSDCSDSVTNQNTNRFKHGGPDFSPNTSCNQCGGVGFKEQEPTDTIKLRVYLSHKDFIKIGNQSIEDGLIQVIGKMSEVQKFEQASYLTVRAENLEFKAKRSGKTQSHGFEDRYFITFMELI